MSLVSEDPYLSHKCVTEPVIKCWYAVPYKVYDYSNVTLDMENRNKRNIFLDQEANKIDIIPKRLLSQFHFNSVALSCLILCDPMNHSTPGLSVHHQLPEFTQIHVHRVSDAIQPSYPLKPSSPSALSLSQHLGLLQWVICLHQMTKILVLQLKY